MLKIKIAFLLSACFAIALLMGCGSRAGSEAQQAPDTAPAGQFGTDPDGIRFLGAAGCIICHQNLGEAVAGYLLGKHVVHDAQITAASPAACLRCHDPIGDGRAIERFIPAADIPAGGLAAIGCENCHGAGGEHFGVGPLPQAGPGVSLCARCHSSLPAGPSGHVALFADNLFENYQSSVHADSQQGSTALCARCHSDEGYRAFLDQTAGLDADQLAAAFTGVAAPASPTAIQCRTCHDSHSGGLRAGATTATENGANVVHLSREFNLCTSCHQVFLNATFDPATETYRYVLDASRRPHHGSANGPAIAGDWVIWDTHFAYPAGGIAGYNINAAAERACTSCHDPHLASKFTQADVRTIAEEWGTSGHADYQSEPFTADITQPACFKCHSGPEFARFLRGVDIASLNASRGPRVVACVACHDLTARDAAGNPAPGALRQVEAVAFPSGATASLGAENNLCLECHQGRSSTATVNAGIAAGNLSFPDIHSFAAAATLFGSEVQGGYEYAGKVYRGRNPFSAHGNLRIRAATCADCHMGSGRDHGMQPPLSACQPCHKAADGTFATLSGSPANHHVAISALKSQLRSLLKASGVQFLTVAPYFGNITTEKQLRAAYNWQVAAKDPAGYIHNGIYIRQLLFDSIVDMGGTPLVSRP